MRLAIRLILTLLLGFVGLVPLAALFDAMNWPYFHTWGLVHGSFVMAVPILMVLAFFLLGLIPWFRKDKR